MSDKRTAFFPAFHKNTNMIKATFLQPIDGDTAEFVDEHGNTLKVRFIGIDAPELYKRGEDGQYLPPQEGGFEAREYVAGKLENAYEIYLEREPNSAKKDAYNRDLYWVWEDSSLLEAEMVQHGYAWVDFTHKNYEYVKNLQNIEKQASVPTTSEDYLVRITDECRIQYLNKKDSDAVCSEIAVKPNLDEFKDGKYDAVVTIPVMTNKNKNLMLNIYVDKNMIQKNVNEELFLPVSIHDAMPVRYQQDNESPYDMIPASGITILSQNNKYYRQAGNPAMSVVPQNSMETEPYILPEDTKTNDSPTCSGYLKYINKNKGYGYIALDNSKEEIRFTRQTVANDNLFDSMVRDDAFDFELAEKNGKTFIKNGSINRAETKTFIPESKSVVQKTASDTETAKSSTNHKNTDKREQNEKNNKNSLCNRDTQETLQKNEDQFLKSCTKEQRAIYTNPNLDKEQKAVIKQAIKEQIPTRYINMFARPEQSAESMKESFDEVFTGLRDGLSEEQIQIYARSCYNASQMSEIRQGIEHGETMEQIRMYADPKYNESQMHQIRTGFDSGRSVKQVEIYAHDDLDARRMEIIRKGFEGGISPEQGQFLTDPDFSNQQAEIIKTSFTKGLTLYDVEPYTNSAVSTAQMKQQLDTLVKDKQQRNKRPLPTGWEDVEPDEVDGIHIQTETKDNGKQKD